MEQEMERRERSNGEEGDDEKWVHDSSVDYKGRVPLRASTGVWKAAFFIITIEISERLSYFGLSTDLISYMSKVLHQDLKTAAKNVNYWTGVTTVMPLLGGFLADAYTGRFYTVLLSSVVYVMGLSLLTMSQFIPRLKACSSNMKHCGGRPRRIHEVVFYLGMYFVSLGTGGHKPCLESFGADQFDDDHPGERKKKMSYFNWWNFALCCGLLAGVTIIVYVDQSLGWGVSYLILTFCMIFTILTFYAGKAFYRYRLPEGSPLTPMLQVLVAAVAKRNLPLPSNPDLLYEVPKSHKSKGRLLCHTNKLRFLDKAAIIEDMEGVGKKQSPWRLVTVTKVEEMKLVLNMVPIWLTTLTFGLCVAQASTFFIKQGTTMNRKIIKGLISIPPGSIYSISAVGMMVSVSIYEKVLVPVLRRVTGTERGIKILQRIGLGMIFSVVSMSTAAMVERRRLRRSVGEDDERRGSSSMSVLWLAPQYLILGFGDGFTLVGLQEYFYDQVPDSMRSLGIAFYLSVIGVGNFYSSLLITAVDHATEMSCGRSWFREDMNESRLDNFYWLLAVMSALNFCVFVFLAKRYSYKTVQGRVVLSPHDQEDIHPAIS